MFAVQKSCERRVDIVPGAVLSKDRIARSLVVHADWPNAAAAGASRQS
jgi:hypothetical protein